MKILIIAEHNNKKINPATLKVISAAHEISDDMTVLVAGFNCQVVSEGIAKYQYVSKVICANHETYEHQLAENISQLVKEIIDDFSYILAPSTTFGKNLMPRIAALLDVGQISDITAIKDPETFVRPIYAGNALATVKSLDPIKVITVRPTNFQAVNPKNEIAKIENIDIIVDNELTSFVKQELTQSERPELSTAKIVVSGGRGLQSKENFKLLESLAERLNAAIGASRAAVDEGFVPNDYQVGQTGKVVAPELYIAVGISGAVQHIAGMKESKCIVAINKDPDAPIFQIADYGLVGDLFNLIPELNDELDKVMKK